MLYPLAHQENKGYTTYYIPKYLSHPPLIRLYLQSLLCKRRSVFGVMACWANTKNKLHPDDLHEQTCIEARRSSFQAVHIFLSSKMTNQEDKEGKNLFRLR
jgi:hypothetical protein